MKTLHLTYGRFNPPTKAHSLLFNTIKENSYLNKDDYKIYVSHSNNKKKNPLTLERKLYWLNIFFPNTIFYHTTKENPSIFDILKENNSVYDTIIFYCGSDRKEHFEKEFNKYNNIDYNYKRIIVNCVGEERNSSNLLISNSSSTLLRHCVTNDKLDLFYKHLPKTSIINSLNLFKELKDIMGVSK